MPIYNYLCADCGLVFEELVQQRDESPSCPGCGAEQAERQFSNVSVPQAHTEEPDTMEPVQGDCSGDVESASSREVALADQVDGRWRERVREPDLGPSDRTLRRDDPERWDLERTYERRQADQLSEIAEKSQRVVKLMTRIEHLEPLTDEIEARDRELAELRAAMAALQGAERAALAELESRALALEDVTSEVEALRSRIARTQEEVRGREVELEEQKKSEELERAELARQIDERDRRLEQAERRRVELESELLEREHRVADADHELQTVRTELESRTAALFKRDEMIREADGEMAGLRDEIRAHDRRAADAEQRTEAIRTELEAKQVEIGRREVVERDLERRIELLGADLEAVRTELARTNEVLEASARENQELTDAWAAATGEVETQRSKFLASAGHLQMTQSVLSELKPMLDALETTLSSPNIEPEAALPSKTTEPAEHSGD